MVAWPSVNPFAPVVAGAAAFVAGGAYWAAMSRMTASAPPARSWPVLALGIGLITRMLIAYALAVILGFAGAKGPGPGAIAGALAWMVFVLSILVAKGAFGQSPWRQIAIGAPESRRSFISIGAVVGAWAR